MPVVNPWHGCRKKSEGCLNCYMFRRDAAVGRVSTVVQKTGEFHALTKRRRDGSWAIPSGEAVFVCMTSDFFIEEADLWRPQIWEMIRERRDLRIHIITKRPERFRAGLPDDWGGGWEHVTLCATCENRKRTEERLPILLALPLKHRSVISEPMLEEIDLSPWLGTGKIEHVTCGGESGDGARECRYEWVLTLREQCRAAGVPFTFKQTGANFVKDGRRYAIPRERQMEQARRAGIDLP